MNNKIEIINKFIKEEDSYNLIVIKEKVLKKDEKFISKELLFGLNVFLDNFFNEHFNKNKQNKLDFSKIEIYEQHGLFTDLFSKICSKKIEIEKFEIINLSQHTNFIYTDYEPKNDWDNVYGSSIHDLLYAINKKNEESFFDSIENCIEPRYKASLKSFNFGYYTIHNVSTAYNNLPFFTGVSWFAEELKDYKIKLNNSYEYYVELEYLDMLYEIFRVLTNISNDLAKVTFHTNHTGYIHIKFTNIDEKQHFSYEICANNIEELHYILKGTNQNTFINFLAQNNLFFKYYDNTLYCSKMSNKKIFSIDSINIKNFNLLDLNLIMCNINKNLNVVDFAYYSLHLLLPSKEQIEKEFINTTVENKLKLFISIFSIKKNIDYSKYALDDNEIAKIYGTTKNNIVETYKKKKSEQYEILRLGATCKAYAITESDLLEVIKNYKLERTE